MKSTREVEYFTLRDIILTTTRIMEAYSWESPYSSTIHLDRRPLDQDLYLY